MWSSFTSGFFQLAERLQGLLTLQHVIKTTVENETNTEPTKYLIGVIPSKFRRLKNTRGPVQQRKVESPGRERGETGRRGAVGTH